jgi:SAM-dependent methyltransferase
MATFAKPTFNAAIYSSYRPSYPKQLFKDIFAYHRTGRHAKWELAVDLGCGSGSFHIHSTPVFLYIDYYFLPGQATTHLSYFDKVIGIDPSLPMIQAAHENVTRDGLGRRVHHEIQKILSLQCNLAVKRK